MPALATIEDVEARIQRTFTGAEQVAAAVFLDEVSGIARRAIPGIDASVAADANLAQVVVGRIAGAVARVLRNPEGLSSEQVGAYGYRRADAVADGLLYLSASELAQMRPVAASKRVSSQKLLARGYELQT